MKFIKTRRDIPSQKTLSQKTLNFILTSTLTCGLVSCNTPIADTPSQDRQELEFWTTQLQPQFTEPINQLITQFEQENPELQVKWVDVSWSEMKNKLSAAIATEAPPDVVNLTPEFMASFAKQQALLSLDDKVPAALQQRYLPNLWQANRLTTCDGQNCTESTVGIPWYLTTQITIYNSALLEQAGLQSPPATYTELANVAQQVKQETGKYAFFVSFAPQDFLSVLQSMTQMGVQWLNADGTAAFNTPEGQAAFQYWIDLYQQDLLPETALTQGYQEAIEMYQAGKLAILSTGPQFFKALDQDAPEIAEVSKVAPQIIGERGQTVVAMMNIVIPQTTDTPDQSLEFALFMTNPENQLSFAQAADVLPSTVTTLSEQHFQDVQLVDSEKSEPIDQARRISASQVQQAVGLIPPISNIQQLQKIISTQLQMALLNQKSIEQSLTDAEQEWNQTLD